MVSFMPTDKQQFLNRLVLSSFLADNISSQQLGTSIQYSLAALMIQPMQLVDFDTTL